MRVIVNGEPREISSARVDALLSELEYEGTHFAIALNYDVVPKNRWAEAALQAGGAISSRRLIGSALYPSSAIMQGAIRASGAQIVTVSLRRESAGGKTGDAFWALIRELDVTVLPNTAGCRTVREAVTTAKLARELFGTSWIKLEVIADNDTLQPDVVGLVEAADILIKDGFEVFPYCTEDLGVAIRLVDAGCKVVMPWAAPIGS